MTLPLHIVGLVLLAAALHATWNAVIKDLWYKVAEPKKGGDA